MHFARILPLFLTVLLLAACHRNSNDRAAGAAADTHYQSTGQANQTTPAPGSPDAFAPDAQGASQRDREITRRIVEILASDPELSPQATNIKVFTVNGKVTLHGPVTTVQQQRAIASVARRTDGVTAVDNQLEAKTNNP